MPGPSPLLRPSHFQLTARLAHGLLTAYCDRSDTREITARDQIRADIAHPEEGPARAESLFVCATSYTASLLLVKLGPITCPSTRWQFTTSGRSYRLDEGAQTLAQSAILTLLRNPDSSFPAGDLLAEELAPIREGIPVTAETVATAETLIVEAVWLAALIHSPRTTVLVTPGDR
jgi:hypothetical protein